MNDAKEDKWPKKLTLINRSIETFNTYLSSKYGERFYEEAFWDGISERKRETNAALIKAFSSCFIYTSLLAFLNSITGKVTFFGLSVEISNDLAPILALIAASALLGAVNAFIDDLMLNGYINQIGNSKGIYSFQLFLLDKMAINLWSDALTPRYFGIQSGKGQKIAVFLLSIITLLVTLAMLCYPITFIILSALNVCNNPEAVLAAQLLTIFSMFILICAFLMVVIFIIPFKFYPADFYEANNEPTEYFKKRMKEEAKQSNSDDESSSTS